MHRRLLGIGPLFVIVGLAFGCGDASQATSEATAEKSASLQSSAGPGADRTDETDGLDEAEELEAADAGDPLDPAAKGPKLPTWVGYVVYVQPELTTPLFLDVAKFIASHAVDNLATFFPPHMSVTGFFNPTLPLATARADFFKAYTDAGGAPFGQPTIASVECMGQRLVELKMKLPKVKGKNKYAKFKASVMKDFHLTKKKVKDTTAYHITLFHSQAKVDKARFARICSDAQLTFGALGRIGFYNGPADRFWRAALYFSATPVTLTNPLTENKEQARISINP